MRFFNIFVALCLVSSVSMAQNTKTKMDSASYALGTLIAGSLSGQGLTEVNTAELAKGVQDALAGKAMIDPTTAQQLYQQMMQEQSAKKYASVKVEGAKFLEENKKKPNIKVTATGLQYEVIKQGTGAKPSATDKVLTHYHGTLISGKVFDSSVQRGEPIEFGVNQVIPGWTEALQLMPCGSKYRLYIPYNLAYGERGAGQDIGPFSTLVFDVELIKINGKGEDGK